MHTRVKVYRNITKQCYSVMRDGHVVAHVDSIVLKNVEFRVSQAGRERVLRERRKNVHAFIVGQVSMDEALDKGTRISYNPYVAPSFMEAGQPIHAAAVVHLTPKGAFIPNQ